MAKLQHIIHTNIHFYIRLNAFQNTSHLDDIPGGLKLLRDRLQEVALTLGTGIVAHCIVTEAHVLKRLVTIQQLIAFFEINIISVAVGIVSVTHVLLDIVVNAANLVD
ncbi:hypothetical protein D3C78_1169680 [compost metagenome]